MRARSLIVGALGLAACVTRDVVPAGVDAEGAGILTARDATPVKPEFPGDADVGPGPDGGEGPCTSDFDCAVGAICNLETSAAYQPWRPTGTCVPERCASAEACGEAGMCTTLGLCRERVCAVDADCAPRVCVAGACVDPTPASAVVSCRVLMDGVTSAGAALPYEVAAFDAVGTAISGARFTLEVAPAGALREVATGLEGVRVGSATVTARLEGRPDVSCARAVWVAALPGAAAFRAVVVGDDDGRPIPGARVVFEGTATVEVATDALGVASAAVPSVEWLVVRAPGREVVALRAPPATALVSLPRTAPRARAGGRRGELRLSNTLGDARSAMVLYALPDDPRALFTGWQGWRCGHRSSLVDAPELGLSATTMFLPDGLVARLGTRTFTNDADRCAGAGPGTADGCWSTVSEREGAHARVTLMAAAPLSALASVLSRFDEGDGCETPVSVMFLPWAGTVGVSLAPLEEISLQLKRSDAAVDCADTGRADYDAQCAPDIAAFPTAAAGSLTTRRRDLVVTVPAVPRRAGGACPLHVTVWSGVRLRERGLAPLGMIAAPLGGEGADCPVPAVSRGLGVTAALEPGQVGLRVAGRPSGAETAPQVAAAMADVGTGFTALVAPQPVAAEVVALEGPFLRAPTATVSAGRLSLGAITGGAATLVEVRDPAGGWRAWVPADGTASWPLPAALGPRAETVALEVTVVRSPRTYARLWADGLVGALADPAGEVAVARRAAP